MCISELFVCQAEVPQDAVAVQETGHVCVGGVLKFAFIFAGQESVYDVALGFSEICVLVELVGLPIFAQGRLIVVILGEKGIEGIVFQAVHT